VWSACACDLKLTVCLTGFENSLKVSYGGLENNNNKKVF
jgi:hypothetical protein